jgi:hypothetical protein
MAHTIKSRKKCASDKRQRETPVASSVARHIGLFAMATLAFSGSPAMAEDAALLSRISPHVSLHRNAPSQELQAFASPNHQQGTAGYMRPPEDRPSPLLTKRLAAQDIYSLTLGARFRISDWLDIGAACALPLTEEEPLDAEDLTIEAMVTMQF